MTQAAYRLLAMVVLELLEEQTDGYLPESQAGGRKEKSTMDALLNVRLTLERVMACGSELGALLTDYRQAFVSTSAQVMDARRGKVQASGSCRCVRCDGFCV
eukprot:COSAG02_NODE_9769_length_2115_cov_1.868056_2_plen_102_part_00